MTDHLDGSGVSQILKGLKPLGDRPEVSYQDWLKLPLKLRRRWWRETDFSRKLPSADFERMICEALEAKTQ